VVLDWVVGVAIFAAGQLSGRYLRLRRSPAPPVTADRAPICGCNHHIAFHADGAGCHAKLTPYSSEECTCQQYVGPQPLPTYVAGELAG
jgi:hypothetical protein